MKKIITQGVLEDSIYYCDNHPDVECYSELHTLSWYGSKYDLLAIEIHLCDECMDEMYKFLNSKFNKTPSEIEI